MRRPARNLLLAAVAALATVTATTLTLAAPARAAGPTATFVKTADWGTGWEGRYTVTNGGPATITGWQVAFTLPAGTTLGSYWDATVSSVGQRHTFTNRSWNGTVAPGASVSFGFLATGSGSPTNCTLNGVPCSGGTPTTPPTTAPPTTAPPTTAP
ncbi:cellulose binding domain-containing protein, partial [Micromonospora sp. URMC 107]|uniref:cellulose binding domain-containing protein n=1 Tax=Micromonospora sp. URMC 107 TaxID=3423418 RepID=UPI003F1C23EF